MFGAGSVMDMIGRIRNNKMMLRKRPFLNHEGGAEVARPGKLKFKKASNAEMAEFRARRAALSKKEIIVKLTLAAVLLVVLTLLFWISGIG